MSVNNEKEAKILIYLLNRLERIGYINIQINKQLLVKLNR